MKVLVAGATGYLGRHLVGDLLAAGHEVRALVRRPGALEQPGANGAPAIANDTCTIVVADVTVPATLAGVADGMDAVVSTIGVTGHGGDPWAVDLRGNLALLEETMRVGVDRFIAVGVLNARLVDSDLTRAKTAFADALRGKDIRHLVVDPSGYFSDMSAYLSMARTGVAVVLDHGRARVSPIHGADLAAFIRAHCEDGTTGDVEVGGPEVLTHAEAAELAFSALGRTPRIVSVPSTIARWGLVPVRALSPQRAGVAAFVLAGLTQDAVAPPTGSRRLADHYAGLARGEV